MRRGCIFCRACSGRGRGSNCCRLYTLSLLLNPVPQELKNELLPPPTHSFTRRDSNGDPRGEPAGYGLQQGVPLWVRRSVLWLHQVECDVHQRYGLGEALPRLSPMAAPGSGAFARFIGSADCTFATVERRKNATIRPSGATSLSTSRSNTRSSATGRRRTPWLTSLRPSSTPDTPTWKKTTWTRGRYLWI